MHIALLMLQYLAIENDTKRLAAIVTLIELYPYNSSYIHLTQCYMHPTSFIYI